MTYVVAVSGGIDSVALLDMMVRAAEQPVVVAHFNHGIREDAHKDAEFVARLAREYGVPYEIGHGSLGSDASEATAREHRYKFLREVAARHDAKIVTAHHADDVIETIAINLARGTGWRGIAAFGGEVKRPLLKMPKQQLRRYAALRGLRWREDSTNASPEYLRNRIRRHTDALNVETKKALQGLHSRQHELKVEIEKEVRELVGEGPEYLRYTLIHMPAKIAGECLRVITDGQLTRPQLERLLHAIKTSAASTTYQAGSGVNVRFSARYFTVELIK